MLQRKLREDAVKPAEEASNSKTPDRTPNVSAKRAEEGEKAEPAQVTIPPPQHLPGSNP